MELFRLFGKVLVETSDADAALKKTDDSAKTVTGNLGDYMGKMKTWAGAMTAAVAGSAVVSGIKQIVGMSLDVAAAGDEIDKTAQKLGMSAEDYQEWAYVMEHCGVSTDTMRDAVKTMANNVATESDSALGALERLGIGVDEAMTMPTDELFGKVIAGLQGMESGAERTQTATDLFGESAYQLNPVLNMTGEETDAMKEKLHDLGGVMSDDLVEDSAALEDSITDLKTAWQGLKNDLAENTIPGIQQAVDGLTMILTGDFVGGLKTAADGVVQFFRGCSKTVGEYFREINEPIQSWFDDRTVEMYRFLGKSDEEIQNIMDYEPMDQDDFVATWWEAAKKQWFGGEQEAGPLDDVKSDVESLTGDVENLNDTWKNYSDDFAGETAPGISGTLNGLQEDAINTTTKLDGLVRDFDAWISGMLENAAGYFAALGEQIGLLDEKSAFGGAMEDYYGSFSYDPEQKSSKAYAVGIPFVPRDDYPARLHYGERVLTRQENEDYNRGGEKSGGIQVTQNIQTIAMSPAQLAAVTAAGFETVRWKI